MKNKIFTLLFTAMAVFLFNGCSKEGASDASFLHSGGNTGAGGSLAKFTINGAYLYTVQQNVLHVYDIKDPGQPSKLNEIDLKNNGVETIFHSGDYLFFGTRNGMLIYGLSDPARPSFISVYNHIVSCDPVVVSGNLAWVTLSTGNSCARGTNQLEVIDISNVFSPQLLKVYPFANPKGLAVSGSYLYLCDEKDGFMVLDISDHMQVKTVGGIPSLKAFDVIVRSGILTITAKDGVYQYDCSDPLNLKFLSKLPSA